MKKLFISMLIFLLLSTSACEEENVPAPVLQQNSGITDVEAFGSVGIEREIIISLDFPAKILSVGVKEGQYIELDEGMATLDFSPWEKERRNLREQLEVLKKEINHLKEQIAGKEELLNRQELPEILKNRYMIQVFEAKMADLETEYTSQSKLAQSGSIPSQSLLKLKDEMTNLNTEIKNLEFSTENLIYQLEAEVEKSEEVLFQKQLELTALQKQWSKTNEMIEQPCVKENQIVCPISRGIVSEIHCMEGSSLSPSEALFIIQDLDTMTIVADVDEQFIDRIRIGSAATVIPDANRDYEFSGKVVFISSRALHRNGETIIPVHIELNQENTFLKPGYNVRIYIESTN